jgi:hypothetical protein
MQQQKRLCPQRLNRPQLLGQRIDQRRHSTGSHNLIGMLIEGHYCRYALVLTSVAERLPDDLLVAQMDPIEEADCQADFA